MSRILIIGPVYPYRGGISHYTGLMAKSLSKEHDVTVFSFKMQYPKLLYKSEQKDYGSDIFAFGNTKHNIRTLDPLNWSKVSRKISRLAPDLIIVQWWHIYFAPAWQGILRKVSIRIPVIYVCHNVYPHESGIPFVKALTKSTLKLGWGAIVHSESEANDIKTLLPAMKYRHASHPTYIDFKTEGISKAEARSHLSIANTTHVLLFFGFIRKYKGLRYLLEAMPEIVRDHEDTELLIVGDFFENDKDDYLELIEKTGCSANIRLVDGYLPDRDVEPYFAACDLVVLPYISATQSGIVQIAYGFEKPVVATAVGGLPDVVISGKTGYLVKPKNAEEIAAAVTRFFEKGDLGHFEEEIRRQNELYSWDRMNKTIESLYAEIKRKDS